MAAPNEGPFISGVFSLFLGAGVFLLSKLDRVPAGVAMTRGALIAAPLLTCSAVGAVIIWHVTSKKASEQWMRRLRRSYWALTIVAIAALLLIAAQVLPAWGARAGVAAVGILLLLFSALSVTDVTSDSWYLRG